jgi:hypothetical protein
MVLRCGQHARRDVSLRRGMRTRRQDHFLAVEARLVGVGDAIERREFLARDALAGVEHRRKGLARVVGIARSLEQGFDMQPVVQQKVERVAHAGSGLVSA